MRLADFSFCRCNPTENHTGIPLGWSNHSGMPWDGNLSSVIMVTRIPVSRIPETV